MIPQVEDNLDTIVIYVISDVLEVISSGILKDKRFKFSDEQILRIIVLREIKRLSLRNVVKELYSNESYRNFCKISNSNKVPCIQILSYRAFKMDHNAFIQKVILLYDFQRGHKPKYSAIDSTMVKPCLDHRARLQRKNHEYTDKTLHGQKQQRTNGNTGTKLTYHATRNRPWL